jgi:hypothetical protein
MPVAKNWIDIDVDVDNHSTRSHLLAVGGDDAKRLLALIGGSKRTNVTVSCGTCSYTATTFSYYDSPTNLRWKMTVPKREMSARPMWTFVGTRGAGGFKFRGRYTFNPTGGDTLELDPPPEWK